MLALEFIYKRLGHCILSAWPRAIFYNFLLQTKAPLSRASPPRLRAGFYDFLQTARRSLAIFGARLRIPCCKRWLLTNRNTQQTQCPKRYIFDARLRIPCCKRWLLLATRATRLRDGFYDFSANCGSLSRAGRSLGAAKARISPGTDDGEKQDSLPFPHKPQLLAGPSQAASAKKRSTL